MLTIVHLNPNLNFTYLQSSEPNGAYVAFFTARAYARAALGVVILSVCPSVCLSHAWFVTKLNDTLQIF